MLTCCSSKGQVGGTLWYSSNTSNGITIQNSFPKGGPYPGPTSKHFNYSHLVFFTRVVNETEHRIDLDLNFSADSIAIPNATDTFMKLFLPQDTMTLDKQGLFSFGVKDIESFDQSTKFQKTLNPKEDCSFYVVAIFYQTQADPWSQERGGNRAELVLDGADLYYRMLPQVDSLYCGRISFIE